LAIYAKLIEIARSSVVKIMRSQVAPPQYQTRPVSHTRWMPWLLVGGGFAVGMTLIMGMIAVLLAVYVSAGRIPSGVTVAGVSIGGKTLEAAASALQQAFSRQTITAVDGARQWTMSLSDLGITLNTAATIASAQRATPGSAVQPAYAVDFSQAQAELFSLSEQANIAPDVGQAGRAMDIPVILDRLRADAGGELSDGVLELNMFEVEPLQPQASAGYTGVTTKHIVEAGQELGLIARQYNVSLDDIVRLNDISNPDLLYVGQELMIPAAGIYEPTQADAPPAPTTAGRSIVVSLSHQRIYAYENGQLVHSHLASTGLPGSPTVQGDYSIYVKYLADDMTGPGYYLPQVPYTMYFYQGYAIHGTYWHNSFGRPMSHGCVNLPTSEAQWFYDWASVGTPVRVIA
jgi:lipoprotein-anchoring transpeptidase ErfK/SrfK